MGKRVGILTLPLGVNYGGIMQAVALSQHLESRGHDVVLLDKRRPIGFVKHLALFLLETVPFQNIAGVRGHGKTRKLHDRFIRRFIAKRTPMYRSERQLVQAVEEHRLDAVIVGSDQVWRMDYLQPDGYREFFLSFVTSPAVRRIAYAASFGTGEWTYPERKEPVKELLARFDAISVREDSGVVLCKSVFDVADCEHVLDPTLLVDPAFYEKAMAPSGTAQGKVLLTYLLDAPARKPLIDAAASVLGPEYTQTPMTLKSEDVVDLPGWLRAFRDADYVLTDSFHGTVFSIIFRKPFVAITNMERGADRFLSLLKALGLSDRLVSVEEVDKVAELVPVPIDYDRVHQSLSALREKSEAFLDRELA